jgi:hypothetical protein
MCYGIPAVSRCRPSTGGHASIKRPMWQDIDFGDVMPNFSDIHPVFDIQCLDENPEPDTLKECRGFL